MATSGRKIIPQLECAWLNLILQVIGLKKCSSSSTEGHQLNFKSGLKVLVITVLRPNQMYNHSLLYFIHSII